MRHFLRILSIAVSALIALGLAQTGVLSSLDNILERQRLEWNNRAPSGDVVLVEIDSASLRELDTWPWPRQIHANLLDRLMDMGADEVAFDVDFSSRSTEENDAAFEAALERAGGYAFLASFEQLSGITGELTRAEPLPRFSRHADPVIVNVILDQWGLVRSVPLFAVSGESPTPAIALELGRPAIQLPPQILIDFSIDLNAIDRMSVVDVLAGEISADRVAGKRVVVGASAIELRDFFSAPRYGIIPGPLVQIAAIETIAAGRVLQPAEPWIIFAIFSGIGLFILLVLTRFGLAGTAIAAVGTTVLVELYALVLFDTMTQVVDTALIHTATLILVLFISAEQALTWFNQRQTMSARLQYLARFDEVSGAQSRYGFVEKLQADITAQYPMLVFVVNIHRLGAIRGALGNSIANDTLREIARRLYEIAPDYVARVGDERFAIAVRTRETGRVLGTVNDQVSFALSEPFNVDGRMVHIDIEIAAASVAEIGEDAADLLSSAELSLGRAGKGMPTLFEPVFAEELSRRRQLDLDMRSALNHDQFRLAMQPQVKLTNKKLVGVEALIRWQHPELGNIPPPELIDLAEETGFIVDIGRWVLNEACQLSASWPWQGRVAVNVSPIQFEMDDVYASVRAALKASGLDPSRLEIEITETVATGQGTDISKELQDLRNIGVSVAIDDFGTGFSSLSYLDKIPFDMLKVDRSFVTDVLLDPQRLSIIEMIIHMGKKLGKTVLVEGVETAAEHEILCGLGCHMGQGYLYGKPVDARRLATHLAKKAAI